MNVSRRKVLGGAVVAGVGALATLGAYNPFQSDDRMTSGQRLIFKRRLSHWGVLQMDWSPDSKRLVSTGGQYTLWDPHTGEKLHELTSPLVNPTQAGPVRFTADGQYVVADINSAVEDVTIAFGLWNVQTGKIDREVIFPWELFKKRRGSPWFLPIPGRHYAILAYEADAHQRDPILVYDTRTWEPVSKLMQIPDEGGNCFAVSADGALLAIGCTYRDEVAQNARGKITLYDIPSGKMVRQIKNAHKFGAEHFAFSPDSRFLASGCGELGIHSRNLNTNQMEPGNYPDPVRVWDVATGQKVISFEGPFPGASNLAFHPTKPWLAASLGTIIGKTKGPEFRIWNWQSGELLLTQGQFTSSAQHIAFSPDGRFVAMAGNNKGLFAQDYIEIAEIIGG